MLKTVLLAELGICTVVVGTKITDIYKIAFQFTVKDVAVHRT